VGESGTGPAEVFQIGRYRVCLPAREILCGEQRIKLAWRSFEALQMLIGANGEVVDRDAFFAHLWPGMSVSESSLNQCLAELRRDLGEPSEGGLIETVAGRGYRLTQTPEPVLAPDERPGKAPRRGRLRPVLWVLTAAVLATLAIVSALGWSKREQARSLAAQGFRYARENRDPRLVEANTLFRRALELDPKLALAYAGMAEVMARSLDASPEQAVLMAERSIRMDPNCVECKAIAGFIMMTRAWRFREGRQYLQQAAAQRPGDARILLWHAQMLACAGQLDRALEEIDRAMSLDSTRPEVATMRAGILYLSGRYEESIAAAQQSLGLQPGYSSAYDWIYRSYIRLNRVEEALASMAKMEASFMGYSPDTRVDIERRWAREYQVNGIHGLVKMFLNEASARPALDHRRYDRAAWKMWIGDKEGAMDELEHLFDFRPFHGIYIAVDPTFAALHGEDRFRRVVSRIGIDTVLKSATLQGEENFLIARRNPPQLYPPGAFSQCSIVTGLSLRQTLKVFSAT
jgi:DNA-binding winged helix-turn-helix (wHTH) protein/Tfp pilus assembly protein PilF